MSYKGTIPFDREGNQVHYPTTYGPSLTPLHYMNSDLVDNFEFNDTLQYKEYLRGRSAAYFVFTRKSNQKQVVVFLTDLEKTFIPHMNRGRVRGRFTFCKRGQNFGCVRIGDNKIKD